MDTIFLIELCPDKFKMGWPKIVQIDNTYNILKKYFYKLVHFSSVIIDNYKINYNYNITFLIKRAYIREINYREPSVRTCLCRPRLYSYLCSLSAKPYEYLSHKQRRCIV